MLQIQQISAKIDYYRKNKPTFKTNISKIGQQGQKISYQ